jgi:hypothetical protein
MLMLMQLLRGDYRRAGTTMSTSGMSTSREGCSRGGRQSDGEEEQEGGAGGDVEVAHVRTGDLYVEMAGAPNEMHNPIVNDLA